MRVKKWFIDDNKKPLIVGIVIGKREMVKVLKEILDTLPHTDEVSLVFELEE